MGDLNVPVSPSDIKDVISQIKGSGNTFAEFLSIIFKDRLVEIYLGDAYEDIVTEQVATTYPAVFCGKIIAAYRECLVVNAAYVDENKKQKLGNILFINERAIRALTEINVDKGTLGDVFLNSRDTSIVRKIALNSSEK